jgi:hypothetical protein
MDPTRRRLNIHRSTRADPPAGSDRDPGATLTNWSLALRVGQVESSIPQMAAGTTANQTRQ